MLDQSFNYMQLSKYCLGMAVLLLIGIACSPERTGEEMAAPAESDASVLYSEDFDDYEDGTLPADWWVEGGRAVYVEDGRLHIEANPERQGGPGNAATVWNQNEFSGDVQVIYDAHVVASSEAINNINFFLFYSHPSEEISLYETRNVRLDGSYNHYHDLNGYIFTFLNDTESEEEQARFRMRRCPGFELMSEAYDYHCRTGVTYRISITKQGDELTYAVDGTSWVQDRDQEYDWSEGLMGVRTYQTDLWIDNFTVRRP